MSRRANATLIGAFVLGGVGLGALAVMLLAGDGFWRERPESVMYFEGDVTGLQVGAPVLFRGVRIGSVTRIGLSVNEETLKFLVPVTIETDPYRVQNLVGKSMDINELARDRQLLDHGLRARLRTQSLLTGQLYVDLDFYPGTPERHYASDEDVHEIPTLRTEVEEFTSKLETLDIEKLIADFSTIADSIRRLVSSPAAEGALAGLDRTLANLAQLTGGLDARTRRIERDAHATLVEAAATMRAARAAIDEATLALKTGRDALGRVAGLADPAAPPMRDVSIAARELAATAVALRDLAGPESVAAAALNDTLEQIAAAARALRLLAEAIETVPESLWQGRRRDEGAP